MAESIAENYFKEYTGENALAILQGLPHTSPKTFEDNWRDFKTGLIKDNFLVEKWGKAISAFANSEGGVLVFGIVAAEEGQPPVDAAHKVEPVPNMDALKSQLYKHAQFVTDPPISNIEIKCIPLADGSPEGFVVCYIPEGKNKPYQQTKPRKAFYLRINSDSVEPPLSILRGLFYPQFSTGAELKVHAHHHDNGKTYRFDFTVKSTGRASIEAPYINVSSVVPFYIGNSFQAAPHVISLGDVLHPKMETTSILFVNDIPLKILIDVTLFQRNQTIQMVSFEYDSLYKTFKIGENASSYLEASFTTRD